jgi:DNA-directed RNA polymerase subunit M/transcription elongation factor TFIIS
MTPTPRLNTMSDPKRRTVEEWARELVANVDSQPDIKCECVTCQDARTVAETILRQYGEQVREEDKRALAGVVENTGEVEGNSYYAQLGDASATRRNAAERVRSAIPCPACGHLMAAEPYEDCPTCGKCHGKEAIEAVQREQPE